MIFRTEMKGGNQKDSSDESRGTPFGVRTSNRACYSPGIPPVRFPAGAAGEQHGKCACRAGRFDSSSQRTKTDRSAPVNVAELKRNAAAGNAGAYSSTWRCSISPAGPASTRTRRRFRFLRLRPGKRITECRDSTCLDDPACREPSTRSCSACAEGNWQPHRPHLSSPRDRHLPKSAVPESEKS